MIELIIMGAMAAILVVLHATMGSLKTQNGQVDNVALTTLAARTAIAIDADFASVTATFLAKRVRYQLHVEGITGSEGPFVIAIAAGNASAAEVTAAWNARNTTGPADVTQSLTEDQPWIIWQDSVEFLAGEENSPTDFHSHGDWHKLGGGKGIPAVEDAGWQLFLINVDGTALTTGGIVKGTYQVQGIWLGS